MSARVKITGRNGQALGRAKGPTTVEVRGWKRSHEGSPKKGSPTPRAGRSRPSIGCDRFEPPRWSLLVAAQRRASYEVPVLDLQISHHWVLFAQLDDFRPRAVGFSSNIWPTRQVKDLVKEIKR